MFGLRYKRPYREYEYSRFSEEEQTTCIVYERQYNPIMYMGGFGMIGLILYYILQSIFKVEYVFGVSLIFFTIFVLIGLLMIIEKDKK